MNEEIKKNGETKENETVENQENVQSEAAVNQTEIEKQKEAVQKLLDPEQQIQTFGKGVMTLNTPIRAGGKDVDKLKFDFTALTGMEYADAMDRDPKGTNMFRVTDRQALELFATAAGKATEGIDATDIRERMSAIDTIKAVQLSIVFFSACNRAGNKRISNA